MYKKKIDGVYLAEVTGVNYRYFTYSGGIVLSIMVSNLEVSQKKVKTTIFDGSFNISTENFTEFIGTNIESEMIGKLFYCYLEKNNRGYIEIKKLYMLIDRSRLYFDPRTSNLQVKSTVKKSYKGMI